MERQFLGILHILSYISPPVRWGLLDFMSACSSSSSSSSSLPDLNREQPRPVFPARPQPRPSEPSVRCRTSTAIIWAQSSLPDLNRDHGRPVFPAGPQPRPSAASVPCRTSTTIAGQCSLPDLNRDHLRPVFPAGPPTERMSDRMSNDM